MSRADDRLVVDRMVANGVSYIPSIMLVYACTDVVDNESYRKYRLFGSHISLLDMKHAAALEMQCFDEFPEYGVVFDVRDFFDREPPDCPQLHLVYDRENE
jgi:hypothetical protein